MLFSSRRRRRRRFFFFSVCLSSREGQFMPRACNAVWVVRVCAVTRLF